ncbi:hypothetical protein [Pseudomonas helleri]|uniref:hypothetical protein n=1 Tax=Pseudomonas helleri TaxID=1608996 RepID=UPI003FD22CBC
MKTTLVVINHAVRKGVTLSAPQHNHVNASFEQNKNTKLKKQTYSNIKKTTYLKDSTSTLSLITPSPIDRVLTNYVPPPTNSHSVYLSPHIWFFNFSAREMHDTTSRIQLTAIESLLIKTLVLSKNRVCSKIELILGIDKNPHSYSGLEMSLSRLQHKFRNIFDERLFRSVRNRGYCLVQDIRPVDDISVNNKNNE